jgi:hypothetical protein
MSDQPTNLDEAMAIFQANLPSITKDEKATVKSDKGNYSYGYAGLDTVSEKVLRELGKLGVSWRCRPTLGEDGKFVLAYRLKHVAGGEETGSWPLQGGTPQQIGSAITYARRYALMAVTGVFPSNEDDDGAAASVAVHDEWEAAKPATETQAKLFDDYLTRIKGSENAHHIKNVGQLAKDARGTHRITRAQYDQLDVAAGARLAELRQETPA